MIPKNYYIKIKIKQKEKHFKLQKKKKCGLIIFNARYKKRNYYL